jgi:hypothetical protein
MQLDEQELSDADLIKTYKNQQFVPRGFRVSIRPTVYGFITVPEITKACHKTIHDYDTMSIGLCRFRT